MDFHSTQMQSSLPDGFPGPHPGPRPSSPYGNRPIPQKRIVFTGKDRVLALFSLFFGYLFCRAFPFFNHPLGTTLFLLLLTGGAAVFLHFLRVEKKGKGQKKDDGAAGGRSPGLLPTLPLLGGLAVFAFSPLLQGGEAMRFLAVFLYFLLFFILLGFGGGCFFENTDAGGAPLLFFDLVNSLLLLPFRRCGMLFPALFRGGAACREQGGDAEGRETSKKGRFFLLFLLGLILAILPTLLAFALLSYDEKFVSFTSPLWKTLFSRPAFQRLFSHVGSFLLGIPLAMLFHSALFILRREGASGMEGEGEGEIPRSLLERETCQRLRGCVKFLPSPTAAAVFLPPLLLYALFFISQSEYYLSAFTSRLPAGFVFSSYAREGFFNLCAVAALNAALLLFLSIFTKKRQNGAPTLPERLGGILLCFATLLLIATAMAKLGMYISVYGLSLKRLMAAIATVFLALCFLVAGIAFAIPQKRGKLRIFPILLGIFFLFSMAFTLVDLQTVVAEYNADAYIAGEITAVDLGAIAELGVSGVPALLRLSQAGVLDKTGRTVEEMPFCRAVIAETAARGGSFLDFSFPLARAKRALASPAGQAVLAHPGK